MGTIQARESSYSETHGNTRYEFKAGHPSVQLIIEQIYIQQARESDELVRTERGTEGFGSSHPGPKWLITTNELKIRICF